MIFHIISGIYKTWVANREPAFWELLSHAIFSLSFIEIDANIWLNLQIRISLVLITIIFLVIICNDVDYSIQELENKAVH